MKTKILTLASALLLAAVTNTQANLITGNFSGTITTAGQYLGSAVTGSFAYDPAAVYSDSLTIDSSPVAVSVTGQAAALDPSHYGLRLTVSPDGSSIVGGAENNDTEAGSINILNGTGTGILLFFDYRSYDFSITSVTLQGVSAPDSGATLALMGFALTSLAGFKRFSR